MKTIKYIVSLILVLHFSSCDKLNLQTSDNNVAVVEAYIEPASEVQIQISKQIVFQSEETEKVFLDGLYVRLYHNNIWTALTYKYDSVYVAEGINITAGDICELEFEYNDKVISAETVVPSEPENFSMSASLIVISTGMGPGMGGMEPIEITWDNPDSEYHMIVVENIEDDPELIYDEDDDHPPRSFRNSPVQDNNQDLHPRSFTYYGMHRVILFKLNPEYAALYEDLETTSIDISAPPSNIQNGLGIFTGFNSDTLSLNVVSAK